MSAANARRGRPKGTGIDDSATLREIASLLAADPDLKPTTAIKSLGFSDPSAIRRLRDKFNVDRDRLMDEYMTEVALGVPSTSNHNTTGGTPSIRSWPASTFPGTPANDQAPDHASAHYVRAASKKSHDKKTSTPARKVHCDKPARPAASERAQPKRLAKRSSVMTPSTTQHHTAAQLNQLAEAWSNAGMSALSLTLNSQLAVAKYVAKTRPFNTVMQQQLTLHTITLALIAPYFTWA